MLHGLKDGILGQLIGATAGGVDFPEISGCKVKVTGQITLTMHTSQARTFKEAMQLAKKRQFYLNLKQIVMENAATRVAEALSWASDHGVS